jgi:mannose-6-phosphate isomerase-like protein (cupin superfamily)
MPRSDAIPHRSPRGPADRAHPLTDATPIRRQHSHGHRHKTQEEIYYLISGTLRFKLDDQIIDVPSGSAIGVAPAVARSIWSDGPDDAEVVICSIRLQDPRADGELIEDFWPVNGAAT